MNLSKIIKFKSMKFWQHQSCKDGENGIEILLVEKLSGTTIVEDWFHFFTKQNLYLTLDKINIFILSKSLDTSGLNKIMYLKVYSRCIHNTRQHLKVKKMYSSRSKNILICVETVGYYFTKMGN